MTIIIYFYHSYFSQELFEQPRDQGAQLIMPNRKNMKNRLIPVVDKFLVRKRAIV